MGQNMFGVVLWSDSNERKAVIWCEDHGDLAFYKQPENEDILALDAGDWVQFDLTLERQMRYAHNPRLVSEGSHTGIASALGDSGLVAPVKESHPSRGSAEVIPFSVARSESSAGRSGATQNLA